MNRELPGYWDNVSKQWQQTETSRFWRLFSDRLNTIVFGRWMSGAPAGRVLKTDLFDESLTSGLYPMLSNRAGTVVGIDVSTEVARAAQSRNKGLQTVVADVRRLPFADGSMDTIVSDSTLDHFRSADDILVSLAELGRILKNGGQLLLTLDNKANPVIALRNVLPFRLLNRIGVLPYYVGATFGPGRLRKSLEKHDFDVMEISAIWHFPRVAAVALGDVLKTSASAETQRRFLRFLQAFEPLSRLPTRFLTGHFIAARAIKRK